MLGALLLHLTRTRVYVTTVAALAYYLLAPRWASWQIDSLRFESLRIDGLLDPRVHVDLSALVSVYNPNHVPAVLRNASLALYRVRPAAAAAAAAPSAPSFWSLSSWLTGMEDASPSPHSTAALDEAPVAAAAAKAPPSHPQAAPVQGPPFGTATVSSMHDVPRRGKFLLRSDVSIRELPMARALAFLPELLTGSVAVRAVGPAHVRAAKQHFIVWVDCLQHVSVWPRRCQIVHSACSYSIDRDSPSVGAWLAEAIEAMDFQVAAAAHAPKEAQAPPLGSALPPLAAVAVAAS